MLKKPLIALYCIISLAVYSSAGYAQQAYAQERYTLNAAGAYEEASGDRDFSVTWTLGEIIGESFHASKKRMTQGFLQAERKVSDSVNNEQTSIGEANTASLRIYPNPCKNEKVYIELSYSGENTKVKVVFFDLQGRELMSEKRNTAHWDSQFNISLLGEGIYFVKVFSTEGVLFGISRLVIIE